MRVAKRASIVTSHQRWPLHRLVNSARHLCGAPSSTHWLVSKESKCSAQLMGRPSTSPVTILATSRRRLRSMGRQQVSPAPALRLVAAHLRAGRQHSRRLIVSRQRACPQSADGLRHFRQRAAPRMGVHRLSAGGHQLCPRQLHPQVSPSPPLWQQEAPHLKRSAIISHESPFHRTHDPVQREAAALAGEGKGEAIEWSLT